MTCRALLSLLALAVSTPVAFAQPSVVVVEDAAGAPLETLVREMRLHVDPEIAISIVREQQAPTVDIAMRARELLRQRDATLVVWVGVERPGEPFVVHVVGPAEDRAILEVVRIPVGASELDAHREVALRVASLLDTLLARRSGEILGLEAAPAAGPPFAPPAWELAMLGELIVRDGDRGAHVALGIGLSRRVGSYLRVGAKARWSPAVEIESTGSAVTSVGEAGAMFEGTIAVPFDRWDLLAATTAGATVLRARAVDAGRVGRVYATSALLGACVGARVNLPSLHLVGAFGVETSLFEQRFLVDGAVAARTGRLRGIAIVGVVIAVP